MRKESTSTVSSNEGFERVRHILNFNKVEKLKQHQSETTVSSTEAIERVKRYIQSINDKLSIISNNSIPENFTAIQMNMNFKI